MSTRLCYLMRGLPSCGKSFTARQLAGGTGIVCETDEYFHTHVGVDPAHYTYRDELLPAAREWNFKRFTQAIDAGITPVVVDRGNGLSLESRSYARYAIARGYTVELKEPQSPWWLQVRELLHQTPRDLPALQRWAKALAERSRSTHRVPYETIYNWMIKWRCDVTVEMILHFEPKPTGTQMPPSRKGGAAA